jgi:hypothetical protein
MITWRDFDIAFALFTVVVGVYLAAVWALS